MPEMRPGMVKPVHLDLEHSVVELTHRGLTGQLDRRFGVQFKVVRPRDCRSIVLVPNVLKVSDDGVHHLGLRRQSTKKSSLIVPSDNRAPAIPSRIDWRLLLSSADNSWKMWPLWIVFQHFSTRRTSASWC